MSRRTEGFVLAPALWMLAVLAALTGVALRFTQATSTSVHAIVDAMRAEDVARSALAFAVAEMERSRRLDAGRAQMRLADATATIVWTNEAARVDLNLAPSELLFGLFLATGAEATDAQEYVARVLQRRARAVSAANPLASAFANPSELASLGLPEQIAARAQALVTVYGSRAIDPRLASDALVASLPGMTEILRRSLKDASDAELADLRTHEASGVGRLVEGATALATRFHVEARFSAGQQMQCEIVIVRFFDDAEPFRILYWRQGPQQGGKPAL